MLPSSSDFISFMSLEDLELRLNTEWKLPNSHNGFSGGTMQPYALTLGVRSLAQCVAGSSKMRPHFFCMMFDAKVKHKTMKRATF